MKSDNCSKFLNRHPVKFAFNISHILSAGFNSGQYGGKKISAILLGIFNAFDLWKAPLSSTIILNSGSTMFLMGKGIIFHDKIK